MKLRPILAGLLIAGGGLAFTATPASAQGAYGMMCPSESSPSPYGTTFSECFAAFDAGCKNGAIGDSDTGAVACYPSAKLPAGLKLKAAGPPKAHRAPTVVAVRATR